MLRNIWKGMTPGQLAGRAGRGFTLMEMMVAVGAVALVAVGLAAIFDSVGKTVTGGRRVSVVNTYASLIESQLRRDFGNMSRDGFLIIRNQWVDTNNDGTFDDALDRVRVSEDQAITDAHGHRIDEIQFVVTGKYRSSRQPLRPEVQAESNTAVVYFGHGLMAPMATGGPLQPGYRKSAPWPEDQNAIAGMRLGVASSAPGVDNPNQYCGNWMLLRHVTLLANPDAAMSPPVLPGVSVYGHTNYPDLRNRPTQFMLQPAASSMFRTVASFYPAAGGPPDGPGPDFALRYVTLTDGYHPLRSSGMVDIASTSLAEIRAVVNTCPLVPTALPAAGWPQPPTRNLTPRRANLSDRSNPSDIDRMQALLSDLMPTESRNPDTATAQNDFPASGGVAGGGWHARIRYEEGPTDLLAAMGLPGGTPAEQLVQAQRRADQLMLSASNFVPHCTDFHVEWSFGMTDSYGQTVWHGLPTPRSQVRPGQPAKLEEPLPYPAASAETSDGFDHWYVVDVGTGTTTHTVSQRLIYGLTPAINDAALTSYFGWNDPTYVPTGTVPVDALTTGIVPWAWPKLVRVTVTLVDPIDPTIESSFQYIFDVPEKQGPRGQ